MGECWGHIWLSFIELWFVFFSQRYLTFPFFSHSVSLFHLFEQKIEQIEWIFVLFFVSLHFFSAGIAPHKDKKTISNWALAIRVCGCGYLFPWMTCVTCQDNSCCFVFFFFSYFAKSQKCGLKQMQQVNTHQKKMEKRKRKKAKKKIKTSNSILADLLWCSAW